MRVDLHAAAKGAIKIIGVIDMGGGERGVYGAGVLDRCMEQGISFDYCVGISAGAANMITYLAGQEGRNFAFYTHYSFRPQYMGLGVFAKKHQFVDLDYVYGALTNSDGEYPLDFQAALSSGKELVVVATDAKTAQPVYCGLDDMAQDDYAAIKASSAIPVVSKPYPVRGQLCFDGALSDPLPVRKALEAGCEKVVVILTRPKGSYRSSSGDVRLARIIAPVYPRIAEALRNRAGLYNLQLDIAKKYEHEGKALIVAPDNIGKMKTLTKDKSAIEELYGKGFKDAEAIFSYLS